MFTRKTHLLLILMIALLTLSGCAGKDETPDVSDPTPFVSPLSLASSVPTPEVSLPGIPTPESGKGTVVGTLYKQADEKPYANSPIYLARVREMESPDDSEHFFAELDIHSAPSAQTDETGRFVIVNVAPGTYAIATIAPSLKETLLFDAVTNNNLAVKIEPGEIVDMGLVRITVPQ